MAWKGSKRVYLFLGLRGYFRGASRFRVSPRTQESLYQRGPAKLYRSHYPKTPWAYGKAVVQARRSLRARSWLRQGLFDPLLLCLANQGVGLGFGAFGLYGFRAMAEKTYGLTGGVLMAPGDHGDQNCLS